MDKISHCVTCLKIETYMSGKNAETFSLIRFGVFTESPKRFFKSPKPSGNPAGIVRSLRPDRAVDFEGLFVLVTFVSRSLK